MYRFILLLYRLAIGVNALYSDKARRWIAGRRNWRTHIAETLVHKEKRIWIHCASLGEFEQGRPLIERLKARYPDYKIVLTFFSPSGYDACRKYDKADYILYLPLDGPGAARDFVSAINPSLVLFVKYEFWHYYLHELSSRNIPLMLVSATFREDQAFFKWYGGFFRSMLSSFSHIHVQDQASAQLLAGIGISNNVSVTGDTRYDRVTAISAQLKPIPVTEQFKGNNKILIAGSTWPDDETILKECLPLLPAGWKLIVAPHEIDARHIKQVQELFGTDAILFSAVNSKQSPDGYKVLIIDNIGMLSSLYAYGDIAWVGGGFAKSGIHNTLEPAIFGLPIVMGPVYQKFVEAVQLHNAGTAFPVSNKDEAKAILGQLISDDTQRQHIHASTLQFMRDNTGAAERILSQINTAGWL